MSIKSIIKGKKAQDKVAGNAQDTAHKAVKDEAANTEAQARQEPVGSLAWHMRRHGHPVGPSFGGHQKGK